MPASALLRPRLVALAAAIAAALLASPQAEAQWKWRDRSGSMQYSDRPPPPGIPDADILQRPAETRRGGTAAASAAAQAASAPAPAAASAAAPAAPRPSEPELEARRRRAEQDEAARRRADEERQALARAENCARARSQLRVLEDGLRISRINERGEREILDDQARAIEAQRVLAAVAADCR